MPERRRSIRLRWVAAALLAPVMAIGADAAEPTVFAPEDLFRVRGASDPQISPDGRRVAYVRLTPDVMTDRVRRSIWLIDIATGTERSLASGAGEYASPRWSPDSTRIAYESRESGKAQLVVHDLVARTDRVLAPLNTVPPSISWSPDGTSIAYAAFVPTEGVQLGRKLAKPDGATWAEPLWMTSDVYHRFDELGDVPPGFVRIFIVPTAGGAPRQLTTGLFDVRGPKRPEASLGWTPDGRFVLVSGKQGTDWEYEPQDTEVFRIAVADGSLEALTKRAGADDAPVASPDGRRIAYTGYDRRPVGYQDSKLYVMNSDGSDPRAISARLDSSMQNLVWAADGRSVYALTADRGNSNVVRVTLDGAIAIVATDLGGGVLAEPFTSGTYSVSRDGQIAYVDAHALRPGEVFVTRKGNPRQLTHLNDELLSARVLGATVGLPVRSSFDQHEIDAWIVTPPGLERAKRYPMILLIHGGPYASFGPVFATDVQLFAAAGYVVLYANHRGSTSYGAAFIDAIQGTFPGVDCDDLMSAVDAAIAAGYADPDRLFVTGGSAGGLLTAWLIGKTDRFKAAVAQRPMIDWLSAALTTDRYNDLRDWFGALPWEAPMAYWKRSAISLVGNMKTPTMVVTGNNDKRTPPSQAEELYDALKLRRVPAVLVRVPQANHGGLAARPSQSAMRVSAMLDWFERYQPRN
jgi:dipeptidyl aminopeptidase/acylaminoacyl peptidase